MIKFAPSWQRYQNKLFFCLLFGILCQFFLSSCSSLRNSYYFKSLKKDTSLNHFVNGNSDLKIQKNDELSILVSSLNKDEDVIYNSSSAVVGTIEGGTGAGTSHLPPGIYPVDSFGNIKIHKLGMVHVEGMVLKELKTKLEKDLIPYLRDPIISIGFSNHKVTILGDVAAPSIITIPQNRLTLIDALTKCGDATADADKQNILIIRDSSNIKQFVHVNLEDISIFNSSYYYLQPNDIVYVSPNIEKLEKQERRSNAQQVFALSSAALSIFIIILDRVVK